jgi:hypothetical protein
MRREIIGKAHHQMDSIVEGTAGQARHSTDPAQAAIEAGRTATSAGVLQVQKAETNQLELRRSLQLEGPEYLAIEA